MPILGRPSGHPTVGKSPTVEQLHGMLRVSMVWGRKIHTPNAASAHSLKTESHLPLLSIWHPQQDLIHPQIKHAQLYYGNKFLKLISEI